MIVEFLYTKKAAVKYLMFQLMFQLMVYVYNKNPLVIKFTFKIQAKPKVFFKPTSQSIRHAILHRNCPHA